MKRLTNRVHKNGDIKRVPSQVKKSSQKTVTVIVNHRENGKEICRLDLPVEMIDAINRDCEKFNITPDQLLERALRRELDKGIWSRRQELEDAIYQTYALHELMEHHFLNPGDGGEYNDSFKCGLVEISSETFKRLRNASEDAFQRKGGAQ